MMYLFEKARRSLIFWIALSLIIGLFCLFVMRSMFINWGFTGDEGLFLSIVLGSVVPVSVYTAYQTTELKNTLGESFHLEFYKLKTVRKNWWWRIIVLLLGVFCISTGYKYAVLGDFAKALMVIAIPSISIYILSVSCEILSFASKMYLARQS